jgi:hypothetical protein
VIQAIDTPKKRDTLLPTSPALVPRRKASSVASHKTYDSEAEARSVHGAIVSFAFKSDEIEPMPALPHGIYSPKLVGSPKLVTRTSQVQPNSPAPAGGLRAHTGSMALPLPRGSSLRKLPASASKTEVELVSLPKLKLTIPDSTTTRKNGGSPANTESADSVVYGSDIIRRPTVQKPAPVRRESASTMKTVSHGTSSLYTGPDLYHHSMGSHSATFEAGDYLETPPRKTGFYRTSTLGSQSRYGPGSELGSRPSTRQGDVRALSDFV